MDFWKVNYCIFSKSTGPKITAQESIQVHLSTLKRFCIDLSLGDSWNYMLPILVPSTAKRITTHILVTAKVNGRKYLSWEALFMISSVQARNYLFKVSNCNTRIRSENGSRLRMKTLEWCQWRSSVVLMSLLLNMNIFQTLL